MTLKSKTVFLPWRGTLAIIVIRCGEKFSRRTKSFATAQAALAWCEKHQANFNYFQPGDQPAAWLN
ncbi:hypothetical protein [Silvimonas sp.]|uniref:hypothetical protein n=1 Tax=Silvimonas sp. TaxID=2650811 RepID=UPI00284D78C7|nr:hypothetical protein [Silvimonas sp.]MDR3427837.1 hypothetical protein [Silvimonas sp.]